LLADLDAFSDGERAAREEQEAKRDSATDSTEGKQQ
jgi:hypothetical protein